MGQSYFTAPKAKVKGQSHFAFLEVKDQSHIALTVMKDHTLPQQQQKYDGSVILHCIKGKGLCFGTDEGSLTHCSSNVGGSVSFYYI